MKPILLKSLIKKILGKSGPQSTATEKPITLNSVRGKYKNDWENWFVETLIKSHLPSADKEKMFHKFLKTAGKWEPDDVIRNLLSGLPTMPSEKLSNDDERLKTMMAIISTYNKNIYHPRTMLDLTDTERRAFNDSLTLTKTPSEERRYIQQQIDNINRGSETARADLLQYLHKRK